MQGHSAIHQNPAAPYVCLNTTWLEITLQRLAQQTSDAQLLITGLLRLTKTITCSTFMWRLPQAVLGEDHPFTVVLLHRVVREKNKGRTEGNTLVSQQDVTVGYTWGVER